jgi:hypothetical protein
MKKHLYILAAIAAFSLSLTACTEPENNTQKSETQTFNQITSSAESQTTTKAIVQTEIAADDADVTTTTDTPQTDVVFQPYFTENPQTTADSKTEPYLEPSSQTEPYREDWINGDEYYETNVYIAHTEPVPGASGVGYIPQYNYEDSQTEPYLEPSSQTEPYQE